MVKYTYACMWCRFLLQLPVAVVGIIMSIDRGGWYIFFVMTSLRTDEKIYLATLFDFDNFY